MRDGNFEAGVRLGKHRANRSTYLVIREGKKGGGCPGVDGQPVFVLWVQMHGS